MKHISNTRWQLQGYPLVRSAMASIAALFALPTGPGDAKEVQTARLPDVEIFAALRSGLPPALAPMPPPAAMTSADPFTVIYARITTAEAVEAKAPVPDYECRSSRAGELVFRIGDHIRLTVFERTDVDDDKLPADRSRPRSNLRSFKQRAEVSGDYNVEEDGSINVPLLGTVPASGSTIKDLQEKVANLFEQNIGHVGLINIAIVERQPVYIVGPVKNPGAYKYTPGMTVLQAVALAGGFEKTSIEGWQMIDSLRELEKHRRTGEGLKRLLARQAVLQSEIDGTDPVVPKQLLEIADAKEARLLIEGEREERSLTAATLRNQEEELASTIKSLNTTIKTVKSRIEFINLLVSSRSDRQKLLQDLKNRVGTSPSAMSQAQGELYDSQQREMETHADLAQLQLKLELATSEQAGLALKSKQERRRELTAIANQIAQDTETLNTSRVAVKTVAHNLDRMPAADDTGPDYEIVRRTPSGVKTFATEGTCDLQPGDLIRVLGRKKAENMGQ